MPDDPAPDDLALALRLADAADVITTARFGALDLRVETKPDLTPVSDADRAVERELRAILERERPADAVLGEEYGAHDADSARRWVIDPIDGTKNFVRGVPVWATLIALMDGDDVNVGVVSAPALGRRWYAARGGGSWLARPGAEPVRCHASAVAKLQDASFSYSDVAEWGGRRPEVLALMDAVWRSRAYGDFWSHVLVAEGAVDLSAEPEVSLWDVAALIPVVEEAGGVITGLDGGPARTSIVCGNAALHGEARARLAP